MCVSSPGLEGNTALWDCLTYVEMNPVRAGLAEAPGDYRFSTWGRMVGGGEREPVPGSSPWFHDHLPFLERLFKKEVLEERRGKLPYLPFVRAPYYLFVGRKA